MKINIIDDNNIIVFLNNELINNIELTNEDKLEKYLKKIFIKLKDIYNLKVYGFYDLYIYKDINYGIVIEIVKDDLYSDYLTQIDMRINIKNSTFLYKIKDIDYKGIIYKYRNNLYLEPLNKDYYYIGYLLEHAELIYKNTDKIINSSIVRR